MGRVGVDEGIAADGIADRQREHALNMQTNAREHTLDNFVRDFVDAVTRDDVDRAEHMVREVSVGEILTRGIALHEALSTLEIPGIYDRLVTTENPGIVVAFMVARIEATGSVTALEPVLARCAKVLIAQRDTQIGARARNLSLAAFILLVLGEEVESRAVASRASALITSVERRSPSSDFNQLSVAATDLALSFLLFEDFTAAARMWRWVRSFHADPADPALMQADWGLSIVGTIIGDRTMVSPLARAMLAPESAFLRDRTYSVARDLWWALVQTARAWAALDSLDASTALVISTHAMDMVTNPARVAPLGTVHAIALLASGRAGAAVDVLQRQSDAERVTGIAARSSRMLMMVFAAAVNGDDVSDLLSSTSLIEDPALRSVGRGYAWLVSGWDGGMRTPYVEPDPSRSMRVQTLSGVVRAATELRLGNEAAALHALEQVEALHFARGLMGWALLLPDADVQALHRLAAVHDRAELTVALPERTMIHAVEPPVVLTERESEVLLLLQRGHTNSQIAASLFISPNTVKFHVANILKRLGVATRDEAAALGGGGARRRAGGQAG